MIDATTMRGLEIQARHHVAKASPDELAELALMAMTMHLAYRQNMGPATRDAFHAALNGLSPEYLLALRAAGVTAQTIIRKRP